MPREMIFSYRNFFKFSGFRVDGLLGIKTLLADPPPFCTKANLYSCPSFAKILISAGRLLAVFFLQTLKQVRVEKSASYFLYMFCKLLKKEIHNHLCQ